MIAAALREAWREGSLISTLPANIVAGITVGIVALPLSMGLAIASGVAPQHGLYTAIVGGLLIALLGGSRVNISGPTAAFVVVLLPVVQHYGLAGLLLAGAMAGVIMMAFGLLRLGGLIQLIPYPVVVGFTSGEWARARTNVLLVKMIAVIGVEARLAIETTAGKGLASFERMLGAFAEGRLVAHVGRAYRFEEALDGYADLLARRHLGKSVIVVDPELCRPFEGAPGRPLDSFV